MKTRITLLIIASIASLLTVIDANAQVTGQWTWMSGDNSTGAASIYGIKGVAAPTNKPGARDSQSGWKDAAGNFWIFGGEIGGTGNYLNDLWEYSPGTGQWTWVSGDSTLNNAGAYGSFGVPSATNKPGSRSGQASWVDAAGNFWIFGGYGFDGSGNTGSLNDLWIRTTSTGLWTWLGGSASCDIGGNYGTKGSGTPGNGPGARFYPSTWVDAAGVFWLFGGYGYDALGQYGVMNDLWEYHPGHPVWTWVSGDTVRNVAGVYGTKGVAAAANKPGGRFAMGSGMVDGSGNFWLFGGGNASSQSFNDLWEYSPVSGKWTWVSGDNTFNQSGVYGTQGTPSAGNKPGARYAASTGMDASGNIWLLGGHGYDATGSVGTINDLWVYQPWAGQWTWVSGGSAVTQPGVFGTKGTPSAANTPAAKGFSSLWFDGSGNIWTMAGSGLFNAEYNDLWSFTLLTVLAVTETNLQGILEGNGDRLSWQTTNEINTTSFVIERSTDGTTFSTIGSRAAAGSGNHDYSFLDAHPPTSGNIFYRVRVADSDGSSSYSNTILLNRMDQTAIRAYPNPASVMLTLDVQDYSLVNTTAKLFDVGGILLEERVITGPQTYFDLEGRARGIYLVQLANGVTLKILKN